MQGVVIPHRLLSYFVTMQYKLIGLYFVILNNNVQKESIPV